jgi:hypothetical protein
MLIIFEIPQRGGEGIIIKNIFGSNTDSGAKIGV